MKENEKLEKGKEKQNGRLERDVERFLWSAAVLLSFHCCSLSHALNNIVLTLILGRTAVLCRHIIEFDSWK